MRDVLKLSVEKTSEAYVIYYKIHANLEDMKELVSILNEICHDYLELDDKGCKYLTQVRTALEPREEEKEIDFPKCKRGRRHPEM